MCVIVVLPPIFRVILILMNSNGVTIHGTYFESLDVYVLL